MLKRGFVRRIEYQNTGASTQANIIEAASNSFNSEPGYFAMTNFLLEIDFSY
jgi:hypothetical protein